SKPSVRFRPPVNEFLLSRQSRRIPLGDDLLRVLRQGSRLWKKIESFYDFWVRFRPNLQAFFLTECIHEKFALDIGAYPVVVLHQIGFGVGDLLCIERLAELLHHVLVNLKVLRDMVRVHIALCEVEERIMLQERVLEMVALDCIELYVGSDASAAI